MSLTKKVSFLVIAALLLIAGVLSWLGYIAAEQVVRNELASSQAALARATMNEIDHYLYERTYDLGLLSQLNSAREILRNPEGETGIGDVVATAVTKGPWQQISLISMDWKVVGSTERAVVGQELGSDSEERKLFEKALAGLVVYSDVIQGETEGERTMLFAAPVRDPQSSQFLGVMIGALAWPVMEEFLLTSEAHALLLNHEGMVIAQNYTFEQPRLMGKLFVDTEPVVHALESEQDHTSLIPSFSGGFESLTTHVSQLGHLDFRGSGWILVFEVPADLLLHEVYERTYGLMAVVGLLMIAAAVIVIRLIRTYAVGPIEELTKAAEQIRQGDYSAVVPVRSNDEVGLLANTFNQMAARIGHTQGKLEEKVAEKTAALEAQVRAVEEKNQELSKMNEVMLGREEKMVAMKKRS